MSLTVICLCRTPANYLLRAYQTVESKLYEAALRRWSSRKYLADSGALEVQAECHYRTIEPCVLADDTYWCYRSFWQLLRWRVIKAWDTIPEYLILGMGTPSTGLGRSNITSAGTSAVGRLQSYIRAEEDAAGHAVVLVGDPCSFSDGNSTSHVFESAVATRAKL